MTDLHQLASAIADAPTRTFATGVADVLQPLPPAGAVTWHGDVQTGTLAATLYPIQSFVTDHVTVVSDPLASGRNVIRFAINDSDRPYAGATNPRGDLHSPRMFKPGDEAFIMVRPLIPTNVPPVKGPWFQWCEVYGPPYGGSPPWGCDIYAVNGVNHYGAGRGARYGYDRIWAGPPVDGKWHTFVAHVKFATDSTGFIEFYFDGKLQTLANGAVRASMVTLDPGVNWDGKTPNDLIVNQYRKAGMVAGTVVTYHGAPAVGSSLAAVSGLASP